MLFSFGRAIISNVLTFYEMFVFQMMFTVGVCWTLFLIIAGLKEGYDYTVRGIAKNLFLTVFTSSCMIIVLFVSAMLFLQEVEFVRTLIGEVSARVQL